MERIHDAISRKVCRIDLPTSVAQGSACRRAEAHDALRFKASRLQALDAARVAEYVVDRANGFCEVCGRPAALEPNRVVRLSCDGGDHPSTVAAACPACHKRIHCGDNGAGINGRLKAHTTEMEQAIETGRFIAVTAAVISDGVGRVLITQKGASTTIAGKWEFPGGKAEPGETLEECLKREIAEELGVEIGELVPLHMSDYDYGKVFVRLFGFGCKIVGGTLGLTEHVESRWVDSSELLNCDLAPADVPIARAVR